MASLRTLYPEIEPYRSGMLGVSEPHEIYFEESGNPQGKPVVFIHGGPGGCTEPKQRRYFDPAADGLRGHHRLPHHRQHDVVGHQLATVQPLPHGPAQVSPPGHMVTQQVAGPDVRHIEVSGDQRTLGTLARARWRDQQHTHTRILALRSSATACMWHNVRWAAGDTVVGNWAGRRSPWIYRERLRCVQPRMAVAVGEPPARGELTAAWACGVAMRR